MAQDTKRKVRGPSRPTVDGRKRVFGPGRELDRFTQYLEIGDCWTWVGSGNAHGYGLFQITDRTQPTGTKERYVKVQCHRWLWEQLVGPIPYKLTLDHLCYNRRCVNPDHLEVVTQGENNRRARARKRAMQEAA